MKCPVCREPDLLMTDRQGIEIDYCAKCRGVWLDRGELDKLIERSEGAAPPSPPPPPREPPPREYAQGRPYRDDDDHRRHAHRKKRGGFLGDLFDFD